MPFDIRVGSLLPRHDLVNFVVQDEFGIPGANYQNRVSITVLIEHHGDQQRAGVRGIGRVVGVHPEIPALTVDHEAIADFMAAMQMMYNVKSADLIGRLKPGDKIRFAIDRSTLAINTIEILDSD